MACNEIWVSVRGKPAVPIGILETDRVHELKQKVKAAVAPRMDLVPIDGIDIYRSKDAYSNRCDENEEHKALDPGDLVKDLTVGETSKNPLYVHYDEQPAKKQRTGDLPEAEANWCKKLLGSKLNFGVGEPLLTTPGAEWDYCGKNDVRNHMLQSVKRLHSNKGHGSDKQNHPLFIAFAGPGQGKSRLLMEFPGLVNECLQHERLEEPCRFSGKRLAFLLTCENGTQPGDWLHDEQSPARFVACRMLWQLRSSNEQTFTRIGVPNDFDKFRATCSQNLVPADVLATLLSDEDLRTAVVVLCIDGMQMLEGFAQRSDQNGKGKAFYLVMQEVCALVNRSEPPFVVGCVAATQCVEHALCDSPQARTYLPLPLVDKVEKGGVDQVPEHELKRLLVSDMGGHGRALECLVDELKTLHGAPGSAVVGAVMSKLIGKYPGVGRLGRSDSQNLDGEDASTILRAALSGKWFNTGSLIGSVNPERVMLVRLLYSDDGRKFRVQIPYIWLHLMLTMEGTLALQPWSLMDYDAFMKPPPQDGIEWEDFNANFRVLRSLAFDDQQEVAVADLHRGALIKPEALKTVRVINRHLKRFQAVHRVSTRSSCCGNPKGQKESDDTKAAKNFQCHQLEVTSRATNIKVTMTEKSVLLSNAKGAPAADAVVMLDEVRGPDASRVISECLQMKSGGAAFSLEDEWSKSCDASDILVVLRNKACEVPFNIEAGEKRLICVPHGKFEEYYGFYAGRAFNTALRGANG